MSRMRPCLDEAFCKDTTIEFTREPNPNKYGRINRARDPKQHYRATDDYFEICARSAMQVLYIQDKILDFLIKTSVMIMRDMSTEQIFGSAVQPEPPLSELTEDGCAGHARCSDLLMTAPYRGWHSLNFEKLKGYTAAALGAQQEHVWVLCEDPSYLADILFEYEDHAPYESRNSINRPFQKSDKKTYRNCILTLIVDEAYYMLVGWQELHRRFADFDYLLQEGTRVNDQIHAVAEVQHIADWMKVCLARKIGESHLSSPNIRKLMTPVGGEGGRFVRFTHGETAAQ